MAEIRPDQAHDHPAIPSQRVLPAAPDEVGGVMNRLLEQGLKA